MAASTASHPFTPFLHGHQARSRLRRARVAVVAASAPDAEPTPAASTAGQGRKKTVDTRIHWSDPDEGWIGGKAKKKEDDGGRNEPLGGRFADLINNPSESHYQLSIISNA